MRMVLILMAALLATAACGNGASGGNDATVQDAAMDVADTRPQPDGATEVHPDLPGDTNVDQSSGFNIRLPAIHTVECEGGMPGLDDSLDQLDQDWLCTVDYDETHGHVYVQATAVSCFATMSAIPEFEVQGAWISMDGQVQALDNGYYDWGGNHQNDYLEFDWNGQRFKYYHSSFGFGWRACHPMDCIQVKEPGGDFIEDGCTMERTLPAVCVLIKEDGTHDELVDTFEVCDGDPNY